MHRQLDIATSTYGEEESQTTWKRTSVLHLADGRVMKNPGLTEELTEEEHLKLLGKGWTINIPSPGK